MGWFVRQEVTSADVNADPPNAPGSIPSRHNAVSSQHTVCNSVVAPKAPAPIALTNAGIYIDVIFVLANTASPIVVNNSNPFKCTLVSVLMLEKALFPIVVSAGKTVKSKLVNLVETNADVSIVVTAFSPIRSTWFSFEHPAKALALMVVSLGIPKKRTLVKSFKPEKALLLPIVVKIVSPDSSRLVSLLAPLRIPFPSVVSAGKSLNVAVSKFVRPEK